MIYRIRIPRFIPAGDKGGIPKIIRGGLWFLIIFSPLPAASVGYWAILTIQLIVIALMVLYLLMKKKPEINPQLSLFAGRLKLPFLIIFIFACVQFFPLPKIILQLLSPGTIQFHQGFSFEPVRVSLLCISLAPFQSFRETLEILTYVLAGFLVIKTVTTKKQLRSMLYLLVGMGVFQSFYGMVQLSLSDPRILFYRKTLNLDMLTGTFINQNHLAGYLAMIFPLAVGLIVAGINPYKMSQRQWSERFIHLTKRRGVSHVLLTTAVIVMCSGVFLSRSRMGLFLILFSFILFTQFSILYFGGLKQAQSMLKKYFKILFVVVTVAVLFFGVDATLDRFALENLAQEGRPQYWANMTKMIGDFPLLGTGLGTFAYVYPAYEKGQIHAFLVHAHNDYLEYLSELGLPGMALLMYIIIIMAMRIFRVWRKRHNPVFKGLGMGGMVSLLLIGIHSFTDFNLHIPANMLLFTLVFSLTAVAVHLDWKGSPEQKDKGNKQRNKQPDDHGFGTNS